MGYTGIPVLTIPRSGGLIEGAFSLVQLLQANRRVNVSALQTHNEMMIRCNYRLIDM